ncbi:MAG TPA: LacI family DNA-binding transcriptional regulator [Herpetosiphonaceae bacterium]
MATIKEVAERAHVSIATVSYVLNGTGSVSAGKRRAVLEAAAALDYRPSYRGRALQAQRSITLGLVIPAATQRVAEPSFGGLLAGITDGAARRGYHLLLAPSTTDQPEASLYQQLFRSGRVDGVIILDTQIDDPRIQAASSEHMPYICAGRPSDDSPFVAIDGQAGMLEAMAHLIVRGHERIGLLQPPLEQTLSAEQDAGYREALDESGLDFDPALIVEGGQTEAEGYDATQELLALPEPPTALIAGTAALAFGALHAIHDQRLGVGRDIALISFEDTPAAAHTAPPLTAVRQPLYDWGQALADGLIDLIGSRAHPQVTLSPQLIVRRSCGE